MSGHQEYHSRIVLVATKYIRIGSGKIPTYNISSRAVEIHYFPISVEINADARVVRARCKTVSTAVANIFNAPLALPFDQLKRQVGLVSIGPQTMTVLLLCE